MIVLVVVQGGLKAEIAYVTEKDAALPVQEAHHLIYRCFVEPVWLELKMDGLVLHKTMPIVE